MKFTLKKVLAVFMVLSMLVAAGCQAVSGLDVNQVIKNMTKVTSAEGKYQMEFKLHVDEAKIIEQASEDDIDAVAAALRQFTNIKLVIDQYKLQDETHASMKGAFIFGDESKVGFELRMTDKLMVLSLDGAKRSFSFDLTGEQEKILREKYYESEYGISYSELYGDEPTAMNVEDEELVAAIQQITDLITDYSISRLPNIERLKVETSTEVINGESVPLFNLQGELKGMELWNWIKNLIDAILKDREELEKLLNEIFTIALEHEERFASLGFGATDPYLYDEEYDEYDEFIDQAVDEESDLYGVEDEAELTPEELKDQLVEELIQALQELKLSMNEIETEDEETLKQVLNDSLKVSFHYGIDTSLNVRKQNFSIDYRLDEQLQEELGMQGFEGFTLSSSAEQWNINGEVIANEPKISLGTVSIESLEYMQGYEILRLFEEGSWIYNMLRDEAHITEQTYWSYVDADWDYAVYVNKQKQAMIPAREIIEEFGGKVSVDKASNRIVLYDDATNTTIEIQVGSQTAIINGEQVQWSSPVQTRNGITFVPARDMAQALAADIFWSNGYLEITREP
ncbi:copper amine oxidase N-terminal domain-containing protein [Paenibacillus septentrionalis]|uniref:Copper amine oxidase N-terminal domain-containing protein n=1 Tax=Paenibacillus septentrionalis TaxID=429342 RepID=A0ABW1V8Y6_9BACL